MVKIMNLDLLIHLVNLFSSFSGLPVTLFDGETQIHTTLEGFENTTASTLFLSLFPKASDRDIDRLWIDNAILAARFRDNSTNTIAVVGPVLSARLSLHAIQNILFHHNSSLDYSSLQKISSCLHHGRTVHYSVFYNQLDYLYLSVNHAKAEASNLLPAETSDAKNIQAHVEGTAIENYEVLWGEINTAYVTEMTYYIKNGMPDELNQLMRKEKDTPAPYGMLAKDLLRHQKNSCMVLTYIVRRAANEAGLDENICLRIAEEYNLRFESAANTRELKALTQEMRRYFCRKVQNLQIEKYDNPHIMNAIRYIHSHRMEKLDAMAVADAIGLSRSYLCSQFKAETGIGISDYIQTEKIHTARQLLELSDYTLSEISEYLSFSSQSYFQTVFKKVTGMTPLQYRKLGRLSQKLCPSAQTRKCHNPFSQQGT